MNKFILLLLVSMQAAFADSSFVMLRRLADGKYYSGWATDASGACKVRLSQQTGGDLVAEVHQLERVYNLSIRVPVNSSVHVFGNTIMTYTARNGVTLEVGADHNGLVHLRIERRDGSGVTCGSLN